MEDDMAVDIEFWLLLAAIPAWILLGCMMTRGLHGPAKLRSGFGQH